jgi:hypothetical protein
MFRSYASAAPLLTKWPKFCVAFGQIRIANIKAQEPQSRCGLLDNVMKTENGMFGIIIGGIVALAAAIFIFTGGDLGGKKTIEGDQDLPPIANTDR